MCDAGFLDFLHTCHIDYNFVYLVKVQKGEKKWNFFPPHLLEPFITIVKTI